MFLDILSKAYGNQRYHKILLHPGKYVVITIEGIEIFYFER